MGNTVKTINTPMQDIFLDKLFTEAQGDIRQAMKLAGYSEATATKAVVEPLKEQIIDMAQSYLAMNAGKAVVKLVAVLDNPLAPGNKSIMIAAKEVLDRVGIIKKEPDTITVPRGAIFFLPRKANEVIEAEYEVIDQLEDDE